MQMGHNDASENKALTHLELGQAWDAEPEKKKEFIFGGARVSIEKMQIRGFVLD